MRFEVSAGVVVTRIREGRTELLLLRAARRNDAAHWVFPKGHVEAGESQLDAALRELREEAGVSLESASPLGVTRHRFEGREGPVEKTVHWFVAATGAEVAPTPGTGFAEARWCSLEEAQQLLVHASNRDLAQRALTPDA